MKLQNATLVVLPMYSVVFCLCVQILLQLCLVQHSLQVNYLILDSLLKFQYVNWVNVFLNPVEVDH